MFGNRYPDFYLRYIIMHGVKIQDSLYSILSSIATLLAVLVALFAIFFPLYLKWKKRPIIDFKSGNKEPFCRKTFFSINPITQQAQAINSYHVRLKILNNGESLAKGCQVKMIAIAHKDLRSLREDFDPVILNWVGSDIITRSSSETSGVVTKIIEFKKNPTIDINAKEYQYLDLIALRQGISKIEIQAIDYDIPRGIVLDPELDDYFFLITVYSQNANPISKVLKLAKNDGFDSIHIKEATKKETEIFYKLIS